MQGLGPRFYRSWSEDRDLVSFTVVLKESDLFVRATRPLHRKAFNSLVKYRGMVDEYVGKHPEFASALRPIDLSDDAPEIVRVMGEASRRTNVGPMAAVAGAIAEAVGKELMPYSRELIVENGGDIFLKSVIQREIGIYAGEDSPFTGTLALEIQPEDTPLGICTSSGTLGHSLSFGKCDASIVLSRSTALADAAATALGNLVIDANGIPRAIEFAKSIDGLQGIVIIKGKHIGAWGAVRLVSRERSHS